MFCSLMFPLSSIYSLGFQEIKRVDILWNDRPKVSKSTRDSSGELYLRVSMSGQRGKRRCWDVLKNNCLPIMGLIDWSRSHPDNMNEFCLAYGIDAGWKYFLNVSFYFFPLLRFVGSKCFDTRSAVTCLYL